MIIRRDHLLTSNKVKKDIVIIQLSDLHYNDAMPQEKLNKIARSVIERNPDYVIFSGDIFFDKVVNYGRILNFFQTLGSRFPVFITTGNHDLMTLDLSSRGGRLSWIPYDRSDAFTKLNQIPGVKVLNDEYNYLEDYNVLLTGFDTDFNHYETHHEDPEDFIEIVNGMFNKPLPKDTFNEISCHSPKVILNEEYFNRIIVAQNADLIHSGHMHNGAVPVFAGFVLPKNRGLIDPYGGGFPDLARGEVKIDGTTGIIGGPLTTLAESQGLKAKIVNTVMPSRFDEIRVLRKTR